MTQTESAALFQKLETLSQEFFQLSHQLAQASADLKEPGLPPSEHLVSDLLHTRKNFTALHTEVWQLADSLAVPSLPNQDEVIKLSELQTVLQTIAEVEQKKAAFAASIQSALRVLDLILEMKHLKKETFGPLTTCQDAATELRQAIADTSWPDLHPNVQGLAEHKHPFAYLLILVACPDEVDDERWAALQDTVTQVFSRQLAVAASRGKLTVPDAPEGLEAMLAEGEAMSTTDTPVAKESQPTTAQPARNKSEPQSDIVHAASNTHTAETNGKASESARSAKSGAAALLATAQLPAAAQKNVPPAETASNGMPIGSRTQPPKPQQRVPSSVAVAAETSELKKPALQKPTSGEEKKEKRSGLCQLSLGDTAKNVAGPLLRPADANRAAGLRDLIWQLLHEDKLMLAYHLAGCLEVEYPDFQPCLPAWLLRAVALGRHVRHADGEIAAFLTQDFSQFRLEALTTENEEWDTAVQFVMLPATLHPSLLAPATGASAVLHTFQLTDELPRLAEYCQHIADYGDGQVALNPEAFKNGTGKATSTHKGGDSLEQVVETWWARAPRQVFSFAPAAKVWGKWREPRGLLHALVTPIRQNDSAKISSLKQAIEKLSDDAHFQREVERTDRDILKRRLGDAISGRAFDQLHTATREAIEFARQWIDKQEGRDKKSQGMSPEQLRKHIWGRQGGIKEELAAFKRRQPSLLVQIGLECCKRAFEKTHALFDPGAIVPTEEPLPRPLLCTDLLRIPSLTLNDQWEVEKSDYGILLEGLLKLLAGGAEK